MSIDLKKVIDVRIDGPSSTSVVHDVVLGPSNLVQQSFKTTSLSPSSAGFTIQSPGLGIYMSRRVNCYMRYPVKFTVYVSDGSPALTPTAKVLRFGTDFSVPAFPLNSLISSATVNINTSNFTTQVQQSLPLIRRMNNSREKRRRLGEVPMGVGATAVVQRQPNSAYIQPITNPGGWDSTDVIGNGFDKAMWTWTDAAGNVINAPAALVAGGSAATPLVNTFYGYLTLWEPLLIQPFTMDDETPSFINTNLASITLNLTPPDYELCKLLRFATEDLFTPSGGAASHVMQIIDLSFNESNIKSPLDASVQCQFYTPPATANEPDIPAKTVYPTVFFNPLSTADGQAFLAGTNRPVDSQVITLNTAPDMIAVYYVPSPPDGNAGYTQALIPPSGGSAPALTAWKKGLGMEDTLFAIDKLEVTWNNNPSLLATFDAKELWRRSNQNGLSTTWAVASGILNDYAPQSATNGALTAGGVSSSGAPILLMLNKDIPVESGVSAGVAGVYTLKIRATVRNQLGTDVPKGTLFVVPITSQYLTLNLGATSEVVSTVATERVVLGTPVTGDVQTKPQIVGGGYHQMAGPMAASSRGSNGIGRIMDMLYKGAGMVASGAGAGAAGLLAAKRTRLM